MLPRVKARPLPPLSSGREQSEAVLARLTAAARRDITALEGSANINASKLALIVQQAQATLAQINALSAEVTAEVAGLNLLVEQLESLVATSLAQIALDIEAIQGQVAGLGTAPAAPTLSVVGPPALHAAVVRITAPAGPVQSYVVEFKASAQDPECPYLPVSYVPAAAFAGSYHDVLVLSDRQATGTIRCYAVSLGVPSPPAALALAFLGPLADPDTLTHTESLTHVYVRWDAADDARVLGYEVRVDVKPTDAEMLYADAVLAYEGEALSFVYPISYEDRESRFRFWVSSRPRS